MLHKLIIFDKQYLIVLQWNSTCIAVNIFWTSGDYAFEKKKKSWPRGHVCMSSVEYVENIFLYITWNSMMFDKWMQECCLFMGKFSFVAVCLSLPMPDFLQAWNDGTKKLWARPSCSTHLQGGLMLGRQIRYVCHHKNLIFELQRFFTHIYLTPYNLKNRPKNTFFAQWEESFFPKTSVAIVILFWLKWAGYLAMAGLNLLAQISDRISPYGV